MKLFIEDFGDALARLANEALEIKVMIAFMTKDGLAWLPDEKISKSKFIVGIDLGITRPEALQFLQGKGADVSIFSEPGRMFHPKAVYLKTEEHEYLIVGSNNLTGSGIGRNHELSMLVERNEQTEQGFVDFEEHFDFLLAHKHCGEADDRFYLQYQPSEIPDRLMEQQREQKKIELTPKNKPVSVIDENEITSLGQFLRLLAKEFPELERRRGNVIKSHPLKLLNDNDFRPLFNDIVSSVSGGRLVGESNLNIGGQWYQIPNIIGSHPEREPWENTYDRGRLVLQIHFSGDYSKVYLSLVIHYNLNNIVKDGAMPAAVAQRSKLLLQHLGGFSSEAQLGGNIFRHWNYKKEVLWAKPLMTFEHDINALPDNRQLCSELEELATALSGSLLIE